MFIIFIHIDRKIIGVDAGESIGQWSIVEAYNRLWLIVDYLIQG